MLRLEYEVATFTRNLPIDTITDKIDHITAEPLSEKYKVIMTVDETGKVELEIERKNPPVTWETPNNVLSNNFPTPHKSVYKNGQLVVYSKTGNKIAETPMEPLDASELASLIRNLKTKHATSVINQAILNMQTQNFRTELDSMLLFPEIYDVRVNDLGADISSITIPEGSNGAFPDYGDLVLLIHRGRNLLLASKLYDKNGETLMTMMMRYDAGPTPVLRAIKQEVLDVLPSGKRTVMESNSTFSNFHLTVY